MRHSPPPAAPSRLLSRVRDIMAEEGDGHKRLKRITTVIASDMVAEVCSVYIRRAGEVLELFATEGLHPSAVHQTRLRVGEGLIGNIAAHARPLSITEVQNHPDFVYRPETGEELYHSLMGVPILRSGRVLGVLAVQNKAVRSYSEEELDVLQTVAMVLAELVGSGDLVNLDEFVPADGIALLPLRIEGMRLNGGMGMGKAVLHQPRIAITKLVAENPEEEQTRLRKAIDEMHGALDDLLENPDLEEDGEHREVLETYRMIAEDAGWLGKITESISGGLTAEAAVQKVQNDIRARMHEITDPYLRERIHDFDDLANRLQEHLLGHHVASSQSDLPDHVVLVARNMGPAQLLDYDRSKLRALVLEEGSPTSHVAIIARALDIPVVGHVKAILDTVDTGETIVVDGDNAQVFVRPSEDIQSAYKKSARADQQRKKAYASLRSVETASADGVHIKLNINAGLLIDMQHLEETGADGVGLYRTEIPFMVRMDFPDVTEQQAVYSKAMEYAGDKPIVFRTLDVGGDKILPYWDASDEENPAMGWRAIRISLDRPAMLRQQLRALIRAAGERDELNVMFPMIAEVAEFRAAKYLLEREIDREKNRGNPVPKNVRAGVMLEVPSLLYQFDALLEEVDFVSVGSNDLLQFLFASDRGNTRLSDRYDMLSPLVLSMLKSVVDKCDAAKVPITLCGQMASHPLEAMALIGLGFRSLSVVPPSVGPVKAMILSLSVETLAPFMDRLCQQSGHSVREHLREFAKDRGFII